MQSACLAEEAQNKKKAPLLYICKCHVHEIIVNIERELKGFRNGSAQKQSTDLTSAWRHLGRNRVRQRARVNEKVTRFVNLSAGIDATESESLNGDG